MAGEVVEYGRPRKPRYGVAIGALAIVVLGLGAYATTRQEGPRRPVATPEPAVGNQPGRVTKFAGGGWSLGERRDTGLTLVTAVGEQIVLVDADTGDRTNVPAPENGGIVDVVAQVPGGWLVHVPVECLADCESEGRLYITEGRTTRPLGEAALAWLDPDARSVWVQVRHGLGHVVERRTLAGARIGGRVPLGEGDRVTGITTLGPLVAVNQVGNFLVDRTTLQRRRVLRGSDVLDVQGDEVAVRRNECGDEGCPLRIVNVRTGRIHDIAALRGPNHAVLDPTARYVAVGMFGSTEAIPVHVFRVADGQEFPVNGVRRPPDPEMFGWSPDGQWLVLAHAGADGLIDTEDPAQVVAWRPGLALPFALPELPGNAYDLTVGAT